MLSRTICYISHSIDQIIAFDRRCRSLTNLFSGTSENFAFSHIPILLKTSLDYIFVPGILDLSSTKAVEFGRIMPNTGHYVVQGHSRSQTLVPIECGMLFRRLFVLCSHCCDLKTSPFQSSYSSPKCPAVWQTITFYFIIVRCPCNGPVCEVIP